MTIVGSTWNDPCDPISTDSTDDFFPLDTDLLNCQYDTLTSSYKFSWLFKRAIYHRRTDIYYARTYTDLDSFGDTLFVTTLPGPLAQVAQFQYGYQPFTPDSTEELLFDISDNITEIPMFTGNTFRLHFVPLDAYGNYLFDNDPDYTWWDTDSTFVSVQLPQEDINLSLYNPNTIETDQNGVQFIYPPYEYTEPVSSPNSCSYPLLTSQFEISNIGTHLFQFQFSNNANFPLVTVHLFPSQLYGGISQFNTYYMTYVYGGPGASTVEVPNYVLKFEPLDKYGHPISFGDTGFLAISYTSLTADQITVSPSVGCPVPFCSKPLGPCCTMLSTGKSICSITINEHPLKGTFEDRVNCLYTISNLIEFNDNTPMTVEFSPIVIPLSDYVFRCKVQGDDETLLSCDDAGVNAYFCNTGGASTCQLTISEQFCYDTIYDLIVSDPTTECPTLPQYTSGVHSIDTLPTTCVGTQVDLKCESYGFLCQTGGKWVECTDIALSAVYCNTGKSVPCGITIDDRQCYNLNTMISTGNDLLCPIDTKYKTGLVTLTTPFSTTCSASQIDRYCGYDTPIFEYRCQFDGYDGDADLNWVECNNTGVATLFCNSGPKSNCQIELTQRVCFDVANNIRSEDDDKCSTAPTTQFSTVGMITPTVLTNACTSSNQSIIKTDLECGIVYDYRCQAQISNTYIPCTDAGLSSLFCNSKAGQCSISIIKKVCYDVTNSLVVSLPTSKCDAISAPQYQANDIAIPPLSGTCTPAQFDLQCLPSVIASPIYSLLLGYQSAITVSTITTPFTLDLFGNNNQPLTITTTSQVVFTITSTTTQDGSVVDCTNNAQKALYCFNSVVKSDTIDYVIPFSSKIAGLTWVIACSIDGVSCKNIDSKTFTTKFDEIALKNIFIYNINPRLTSLEIEAAKATAPMFISSHFSTQGEYDKFNTAIDEHTLYVSDYHQLETSYSMYIVTGDQYGNLRNQPAFTSLLYIAIPTSGTDLIYIQCQTDSAEPSVPTLLHQDGSSELDTAIFISGQCYWNQLLALYELKFNLKHAGSIFATPLLDGVADDDFVLFASIPLDPSAQNSEINVFNGEMVVESGSSIPSGTSLKYVTFLRDKYNNIIYETPVKDLQSSTFPTSSFDIEFNYNRQKYANFGLDSLSLTGPDYFTQIGSDDVIVSLISFNWVITGALPYTASFRYNAEEFSSFAAITTPLVTSLTSSFQTVSIVTRQYIENKPVYNYQRTVTFQTYDQYGNLSPFSTDRIATDIISKRISGSAECPIPICPTNGCCDPITTKCTILFEYTNPDEDTVCNYSPYSLNQYTGFLQNDGSQTAVYDIQMLSEAPSIYEYRCVINVFREADDLTESNPKVLNTYIMCSTDTISQTFCSSVDESCSLTLVTQVCFDTTLNKPVTDFSLCQGGNANTANTQNSGQNNLLPLPQPFSISVPKCPTLPNDIAPAHVALEITFATLDTSVTPLDLMCGYTFQEPDEPTDLVDGENAAPQQTVLFVFIFIACITSLSFFF